MFIIINTNNTKGFTFMGPFLTSDDAIEHAQLTFGNGWIVHELEKPVK